MFSFNRWTPVSGVFLTQGGTDARYVSTGHLLYMKLGTLSWPCLLISSLQLTGPPVAMIEGVMHAINAPNGNDETGVGQFAISHAGTIAYILGGVGKFLESSFVWVNGSGAAEPLTTAPIRPYCFRDSRLRETESWSGSGPASAGAPTSGSTTSFAAPRPALRRRRQQSRVVAQRYARRDFHERQPDDERPLHGGG